MTPFLDLLTDHNQIDDASKVWSDLQRAGSDSNPLHPRAPPTCFTTAILGVPLSIPASIGASADRPIWKLISPIPPAIRVRNASRVEFPVGRDAEYDLLSQLVRVKPNTRYQFSAYLRSDSLTSQSGPRLRAR